MSTGGPYMHEVTIDQSASEGINAMIGGTFVMNALTVTNTSGYAINIVQRQLTLTNANVATRVAST